MPPIPAAEALPDALPLFTFATSTSVEFLIDFTIFGMLCSPGTISTRRRHDTSRNDQSEAATRNVLRRRPTLLELGPGNGLLTGKFAAELGASKTWLIDAAAIAEPASFPNTEDLSNGLASLRTVPTASVDFLFSNAVLEHVRLNEFADTVAEMRRIVKSGGICSHQIDFRDHLGGSLNNLRFSEHVWESKFMAKSGFTQTAFSGAA